MMNADVLNRLLQQPSLLKETTVADLEMMAYQYPWFGTAQLLLAAKQKQTGALNADKQVQKAMIYFNQPLWSGAQLNRFIAAEPATVEAVQETETIKEVEEKDALIEIDETDASLDAEAIVEAEDIRDVKEANVVTDAVLDVEFVLQAEADKETEQLLKDAEIEEQAEAMIEADSQREVADFITNTDAELAAEATIGSDFAKEELMNAQKPESVEEKPVFTFEPFHTVDYFASQGIKLREEKLENDQLGKQVKSFTQWLRSMKKIYVEEKKDLNLTDEKEVVSIATESNQQTEVVTETMAEVLAKQGKKTQAIDLYRKLSLLHPEKSVYFASRIDELKQ
ncbi:hypothetical protein WG954_17215 [Lacibacter sp. H375]|uniref:hypothetical protein n=1 Tax=Lacibacter sp. H375 TaxID=3133424 RepID=UPI0030BB7036